MSTRISFTDEDGVKIEFDRSDDDGEVVVTVLPHRGNTIALLEVPQLQALLAFLGEDGRLQSGPRAANYIVRNSD